MVCRTRKWEPTTPTSRGSQFVTHDSPRVMRSRDVEVTAWIAPVSTHATTTMSVPSSPLSGCSETASHGRSGAGGHAPASQTVTSYGGVEGD